MAALQQLVMLACLLASIQLAIAGCAGEIFNCNGDRNPCTNKQCGSGTVCRVDNCKGCFAKCEPPGMVHIMSVPSAGQAMPSAGPVTGPSTGSGSTTATNGGSSSTPNTGSGTKASEPQCACPLILSPVCGSDGKQYANKCLAECAKVAVTPQKPDSNGKCPPASSSSADNNKVVEEAGCKCPRNFMPVCGSDGKKYNNKCLAECAKVTVLQQQPDKDGKCPQGAYGNTSSKPQQNQPAGRPQGFTCRCARMYKPVCGTDGVFYDNECLAICEGVQIAEVKPDLDAKRCNMKRN